MSQCRTSNVQRAVILIALVVILVGLVGGAVVEVPAKRVREGRLRGPRKRDGKKALMTASVHPNPYPCKPRTVSVSLPHPPPGKLYMPSCAVVKRCTGCCSIDAIECIPRPGVKQGIVKWKTNEFIMKSNGQWKSNGVRTFEIVEHTKCTCGCKIREEHCSNRTTLQVYDRNNCQCFCMNVLERLSCGPPKIWDDSECKCSCPPIECSTGSYIDSSTCRCISGEEIAERVEMRNK